MGAIKEKLHASLTLASDEGGLSISRIGHFMARRRALDSKQPQVPVVYETHWTPDTEWLWRETNEVLATARNRDEVIELMDSFAGCATQFVT
jgi:hypothetical protein